MRRLVEEGRIGAPHLARFSLRDGTNYVDRPYLAEIERFTIMDVGPRLFDLSLYFVGKSATFPARRSDWAPGCGPGRLYYAPGA